YQRVNRKKKNKIIEDITTDLDRRGEKPKFIYFTEKDFERILEKASYDMKPTIALAFDSGARPTELMNIRVCDFSNDFKEVMIREETSKTFGRRIKLMMCSEQVKNYVSLLGLKSEDYIIQKSMPMVNKELRFLGKKVLTKEQLKFKNLAMYDFRHSSACFWLVRYKSESSMKYRFGWKKTDMIHYYTEYLGMKDTITVDDMYIDITKMELEKEVDKLKEQVKDIQELKDFQEHYKKLFQRIQEKPKEFFISEDGELCEEMVTEDGQWIN
ncbi:MAG: tyrosine-type recombinase/integrase, partial [Nanoarchaeota archaeon]